jgi:hypothetical protein
MPGHEGIEGNETANQLAKLGSEYLLIWREPACVISAGTAKKTVRDWPNRAHQKYWESLTGLKQAKGFLRRSSIRRTKELLKINRNQLRRVTGLLTGYCHLRGYLFQMVLLNGPICEWCLEKDESATHTLWLWGHSLFKILSPGSLLYGARWSPGHACKILHFVWRVGLLKGWHRRIHNRSLRIALQGPV